METSQLLLQTTVSVTGATAAEVGCDNAATVVAAAAAAASIQVDEVTYWLQSTESGGTELVLQIPVETREQGELILQGIETVLGDPAQTAALLASAPSGASVSTWDRSDGNTTAVLDSPYLEDEEDDGVLDLWIIVVIAVAGTLVVGGGLAAWCCCCGGASKAKVSDDKDAKGKSAASGKRQAGASAGEKAWTGADAGAQAV